MPPLTVDELLALPYSISVGTGSSLSGNSSGDGSVEVLSLPELLGLDYIGGPAFSKGLIADVFRQNIAGNGERVKWLRAVEGELGPNGEQPTRAGKVFVEQPLASGVRVFLYQNTRDVAIEEFGLLARGSAMISFMPDEIDPIRDDRFVALERTLTSRMTLTPSGEAFDALEHAEPVSISAMFAPGRRFLPSEFSVSARGIEWTGAPPTESVTVIYKYRPHFEWQGENAHQAFIGQDGARLPGSGPVRLLSAREE